MESLSVVADDDLRCDFMGGDPEPIFRFRPFPEDVPLKEALGSANITPTKCEKSLPKCFPLSKAGRPG